MSERAEAKYSSFPRYLEAKKTVDDRALNGQVWARLAAESAQGTDAEPINILEIGAGIGTMVQRVLERGLIRNARYTALDAEKENIAFACARLPGWAQAAGFEVEVIGGSKFHLQRTDQNLTLSLMAGDVYQFLPSLPPKRPWDLLIAHAFLDLVNLDRMLPLLLDVVRPGGLVYFTINFDGVTLFEPVPDPAYEAQLMALYHQTMDERIVDGKSSGDSLTGRHLFAALARHRVDILAAGSSDWVVFPGPEGYPAAEAYFLHFILQTIHAAMAGHLALDQERFADWVALRHDQVEQETLKLIVHQLDFLGRKRA